MADPAGSRRRIAGLTRQVEQLRAELDLRRDLEERLSGMLTELEAASRAKSKFLAQMSHELRTPLNAVIGFAEIMLGEMFGPLQPRYALYAKDILLSGQLLLEMIEEVLDLSRIEAGATVPSEDHVDLRQMLEASSRMVEPRAQDKQVAVHLDAPPELPLLRADGRMLKQILLNLLSNAVKFTPSGGNVHLVAAFRRGEGVRISVSDTGVGIPEAELAAVLEPFQRGSNAVRDGIPGTGLGLTITQHLVELHGGRLQIDSRLGRGTTVLVKLPAERVVS